MERGFHTRDYNYRTDRRRIEVKITLKRPYTSSKHASSLHLHHISLISLWNGMMIFLWNVSLWFSVRSYMISFSLSSTTGLSTIRSPFPWYGNEIRTHICIFHFADHDDIFLYRFPLLGLGVGRVGIWQKVHRSSRGNRRSVLFPPFFIVFFFWWDNIAMFSSKSSLFCRKQRVISWAWQAFASSKALFLSFLFFGRSFPLDDLPWSFLVLIA